MAVDERNLPVLRASRVEAKALGDTLHSIAIDDASLVDTAYQALFVAKVREAAGPVFDDLADRARGCLRTAPWCVVIRGLPVEQATQMLVAISATLGDLVEPYRQSWSQVVRHIIPSCDRAVDGRVLNEFLHTDGTNWPRLNDYTCLFCVQPDQHGDGKSRLLDLDTLMGEMTTGVHSSLLTQVADQPVPWRIAEELGGGGHWAPIVEVAPPRIRWLRYTVMLSFQEGLAMLADETVGVLRKFERFVESCPGIRWANLESGDLLLVDNTRCLHARTAIGAPFASAREFRRTKVMKAEALR
jgi:hypothetical protein